jgi:hypothetical protein
MDNAQPRSALQILGELANGNVISQLTEEIAVAHAAVLATQRPAKVTISLVIKPAIVSTPGVNADMLQVIAEISNKIPKPPSAATIFFVDGKGQLSRNQDRQRVIPGIRDASGDAGAVSPSTSPQAAG